MNAIRICMYAKFCINILWVFVDDECISASSLLPDYQVVTEQNLSL